MWLRGKMCNLSSLYHAFQVSIIHSDWGVYFRALYVLIYLFKRNSSLRPTVAINSHRQRPDSLPPPSSSGWAIPLSVSCWCSMDRQPGKSLWGLASSAASQSHPAQTYTYIDKACYLLTTLLNLFILVHESGWLHFLDLKSHLSGGVTVSVIWLVCRRRKVTGNGPFVQI